MPAEAYRLHVYDHCSYCSRVDLVFGRFGIPYEREVYGYAEGGDPALGGYGVGPVPLTGKKALPVLEGPGVPIMPGARGMPESLDIIAFLAERHSLRLPMDTGRLGRWKKRFCPVRTRLVKPRITAVAGLHDFADSRDVAYFRRKYRRFDFEAALAETPRLLEQAAVLLLELEALLQRPTSVNRGGFGMTDVLALGSMKPLTAVRGVAWPPRVWQWMIDAFGRAPQCRLYDGDL